MNPRPKAREPYDENRDFRADHSGRERDFYDKRKEGKPHVDKFTPRRRGPAKIKFPMRAKKALMLLTGKTGKRRNEHALHAS